MSAYRFTKLTPLKRGDTFVQTFTIKSAHIPANFTGGVFCTLRTSIPATSVADDSGAVLQVSDTPDANGGITWSSSGSPAVYTGTITFAAEATWSFPIGDLFGEIRGVIGAGSTRVVSEVGLGSFVLPIYGDLKRSK